MYTPVNPKFTIYKWGVRGYTLHGHVSIMNVLCRLLNYQETYMKSTPAPLTVHVFGS